MPQYEECRRTRLLATICDTLRDEPGHVLGRTRWHQRVFYQTDDGAAVRLREVWRWRKLRVEMRGFVRRIRPAAAALHRYPGRSAGRLTPSLGGNQEAA